MCKQSTKYLENNHAGLNTDSWNYLGRSDHKSVDTAWESAFKGESTSNPYPIKM